MQTFLKNDEQSTVSGTDITINKTKSPDVGTNFLSTFLGGVAEELDPQNKQKKARDKLAYYTELRNAGYSAEEATARLKKDFSGGFLENIINRNSAGFTPPASDPYALSTEKARLANENTKADIEVKKSKARYWDSGGASSAGINTMTSNQLQSRLKYLEQSLESDEPEVQDEIKAINARLRALSMKDPGKSESKEVVGTFKSSSGKPYKRFKDGSVEWL